MYHQERVEEVRTEQRSSGGGTKMSFNNNLSELDTLLQDLNNARYTGVFKEPAATTNGTINGSRPSVDSLLDELNSVDTSREIVESHTVTHEVKTTKLPIASSTSPQPMPAPLQAPQPQLQQPQPQQQPPPPSARAPHPSASSATKELDDLMASLSDFKINASSLQTQVDSAYAKPQKPKSPSPPTPTPTPPTPTPTPPKEPTPPPVNQLDCMLGSLATHMTEQGITTTQKGCCCACDKPIVGQVITALGKTWHPEHFTCTHCNQELGTRNFFERDGKPYCEVDYHNLFSPRCAYCDGPILDKCVTALDKTWHPDHFFCAQCGNTFGEDGFHEKDGKPYCRNDYFNMFAPKCGGCNAPIMDNYISALNAQWHPECFVCRDCKQPIKSKQYYCIESKPVCSACVGVSDDDEDGDEEEDE
uniref:Paxillin n=2 Tax=Macrobrachium nipponense TaxID=159736 RepID=A0A7G9M9K0_MACNP|nr:Paxillin [Macrobrachium nipponense]